MCDALGLGVAVVHQPRLAFERRRGVSVERLVAMEEDVPLAMEKLESVELHTGEDLAGGEIRLRPLLRPVGADEDDRAGGDAAVLPLPGQDVGDGEVIARILLHLRHDRKDDQGPERVGWRQLVDRRIARVPMGRRIELRAELVGPEAVAGGLEAVLLIGVRLAGRGIQSGTERGRAEAGPDRNRRADRMRQVDVFGFLEGPLIHLPQRRSRLPVGGRGHQQAAGHASHQDEKKGFLHRMILRVRSYPGRSVGLFAPGPCSGGFSPPRASASSRWSRSG